MDATPPNDVSNVFKGGELDVLGVFTFPGLLAANFGRVYKRDANGKIIPGQFEETAEVQL
jgi:hypothetical protein